MSNINLDLNGQISPLYIAVPSARFHVSFFLKNVLDYNSNTRICETEIAHGPAKNFTWLQHKTVYGASRCSDCFGECVLLEFMHT